MRGNVIVGRWDGDQAPEIFLTVQCRSRGDVEQPNTSCGNPNCRCRNPDQRHGPYWQLTWKEAGKTVTRRLSAKDATLYREWIANRRQLEAVLEQMRDLSRHAGEYMLADKGRPFHGPQRPRARRRPVS